MGKMTVYVPDDLAAAARAEHLNVSAITQEAIRERLRLKTLRDWLDSLPVPGADRPVSHAEVITAVHQARE
ncbi:MAG: antitoxin, partial [Candidatus Dormibacteria bacterium]